MTPQAIMDTLQSVRSLEAMQFYATKSDNKGPELHCRIWSFNTMPLEWVQSLAGDLNKAIQPVIRNWMHNVERPVVRHYEEIAQDPSRT